MRIYLSASHAPEDLALLDELLKQLKVMEQQGTVLGSVRHVTPGGDARSERLRMLAAADVVLLLVSADARNDDGWRGEAREAVLSARRRGAVVIPVLLRPTMGWEEEDFGGLEPLPRSRVPLNLCVGPQRELALCEVAAEVSVQLRARKARSRPNGSSVPPPAAAYDPRHYVSRPREERQALRKLQNAGAAVVLQGPRGFGKGTLVSHLLTQIAEKQVRVDLGTLDPAVLRDATLRLRCLGELILRALLPERLDLLEGAFQRPGTAEGCLHGFLADHLLGDPLLLCIENAARLHGLPGEQGFFAMLRGLAESQLPLRLLLTVETEPTLLDSTDHSGFFARASIMELRPLTHEQVAQMAAQYNNPLVTEAGLKHLCQRTAGHPYLARLWLYEAAMREESLEACEGEVFESHLRGLRRRVDEAGLAGELRRALSGTMPAAEAYVQLYSLGLLLEQDGACQVRCPLYEDFVKARWQRA